MHNIVNHFYHTCTNYTCQNGKINLSELNKILLLLSNISSINGVTDLEQQVYKGNLL